MKLVGRCSHCGNSCEWRRDDDGSLTPSWPCERSPTGHCEPESAGSRMVRQIAGQMDRRPGFPGRNKRR